MSVCECVFDCWLVVLVDRLVVCVFYLCVWVVCVFVWLYVCVFGVFECVVVWCVGCFYVYVCVW